MKYTIQVTKEEAEYLFCAIHHEEKMKRVTKQLEKIGRKNET